MKPRKLAVPLLLLAACSPLTGQPGSPRVPTPTPVAPPTGPAPTVVAGQCPDPADTPNVGGDFNLPPRASWARICGTSVAGTGTEPGVVGERVRQAPPDALVTNLDGLIEFANALPIPDGDLACTMEFGPAYTLVVGYPDGSTQMITGELYGCRFIANRIGAQELLDDFGNRLRAQRDAYPGLAPVIEPCVDAEQGVLGDLFVQPNLEQTSTAVINAADFEAKPRVQEVAEWPMLRDAILADSQPYHPEPDPTADSTSFGPAAVIEAINPQCEALTLQVSGEGVFWNTPGDHVPMIWQPDAASREILQPYLDWANQVR